MVTGCKAGRERVGNAVFALFLKTVREHGLSLILTTHNLALAERCDRVITLEDGRVAKR